MDNTNERRFREVALPRIDARLAELEAENKQLRAALSQRPADPAWISASERLPEDSRHVIIYLLGIMAFVGHYNHGKKKWRMGSDTRNKTGEIMAVTHWQPLPAPPLPSPVPPKEQEK